LTPSVEPQGGYAFKNFKYSSHYWILRKLEQERKPVRILDVGCASGYLGKILGERGHHVTGIESDAAAAEEAGAYYDLLHVDDIEMFSFPYCREFDYILFADVLEHLRDPAAVLRRSLPALTDSGKVVVSVPNIANWIIRLNLLFGNFDYTDRGILDKTHLHFFTLRTLRRMMNEASCRVLDVTPTPLPIQLALPLMAQKAFAPLHALHYALTRSWKTMFAYQFVVTAAPSGQIPFREGHQVPAEMIKA